MTGQVSVPQIQTQTPAQPQTQVAGQEDFDDLPPQNEQGEEISMTSGDAVEAEDPGFIDFETLLSRPAAANEVPAAPAPGTPPIGDTTVAPVTVAPAQATPIAPAQPAVTAQPVVPPQGQAPTTPPTNQQGQQPQQVQGQQPPQPQAAPTQVADPEKVLQQLQVGVEQSKTQLVEHVAKHYEATLTDEDVELLQTDPKKALSMMAGRVHVDGLSNILSVLSANLPTMVYAMMEGQQKQQKETDAFYSTYTMFDRQAHGATINQLAGTLRQMNPQMDPATFKSMLAATAIAHLRLQPAAPQVRAPNQQQPQQRAPRGFTPAGGGQPPAPQANPNANNPWAGFVEAFSND